jgi:hypothetical protein
MQDSLNTLTGRCHCGRVSWTLSAFPQSATSCNCTVCRRYGVLWAYGHEGESIQVDGNSQAYVRGDQTIAFHFCPSCGGVTHWRARHTDASGRRRMAVNLRMGDPQRLSAVPVRHFDGLDSFQLLPPRHQCVADYMS